MPGSTRADPSNLEKSTTIFNPAEGFGLQTSDSSTSSISQYHSALNSPLIACENSKSPIVKKPEVGNLISFSSGSLTTLAEHPEPDPAPPSPPVPSLGILPIEPMSPEFSSNRHADWTTMPRPEPSEDAGKNPNVYINGLPPYFREDQLLAITAPFGEVLSVRCFTRHTTKAASGYGFVLFKTLAAAEKCIVTLKRSDLHPSFSKVNKPPRIVCAPYSRSLPTPSSSSSLGSAPDSPSPEKRSFKAKLAQLEDKNSTNVYIEGLPMSADKNTLLELVYPYPIHSSRFLRSKLPESQTMIAFMRLESRGAAEEVIGRLNGKNVRGWDGAESRVYMRIADTFEQRELRRSESSTWGEESDRLSIAQATLLTYRGAEFRSSESLGALQSVPSFERAPTRAIQSASYPPAISSRAPAIHPYPPPPPPALPLPLGDLPHPLAARVHELLTFNAGAAVGGPMYERPMYERPMYESAPRAGARAQLPQTMPLYEQLPQLQTMSAQIPLPQMLHAPLPLPRPLPLPPMHARQDPLYAPYAHCPPPPPLHPNVAALFAAAMAGAGAHANQFKSNADFNPFGANANANKNQFNANQFNTNANHVNANANHFNVNGNHLNANSHFAANMNTKPFTTHANRDHFNPGVDANWFDVGANANANPNRFSANGNAKPSLNLKSTTSTAAPSSVRRPPMGIQQGLRSMHIPVQKGGPTMFMKNSRPPMSTRNNIAPPMHIQTPAQPASAPRSPSFARAARSLSFADGDRPMSFADAAPASSPLLPASPFSNFNTNTNNAFGAHARAATAPVQPRCDVSIADPSVKTHTNINAHMKMNTNTNTNTGAKINAHIKTNTNTNMPMNAIQNQNQNHPAPAQARVFLGPQDVLRLPLLSFA
ncbi:hypothetical protein C8R44DRAFT_853070 [Mycena epipterygia]|nr:hypothetical protein C8R44DRAFT_853070 [Mycena epipterygia]